MNFGKISAATIARTAVLLLSLIHIFGGNKNLVHVGMVENVIVQWYGQKVRCAAWALSLINISILENYKDSIHLMVLLVDARPEEVTEFKRSLPGAEVYASSNDGRVRDHCRMSELCIERAKRLVEAGHHVFLLMYSITRLARALSLIHI